MGDAPGSRLFALEELVSRLQQTIGHAHIHLIPRRQGDVQDPRGGVRGVIPAKVITSLASRWLPSEIIGHTFSETVAGCYVSREATKIFGD